MLFTFMRIPEIKVTKLITEAINTTAVTDSSAHANRKHITTATRLQAGRYTQETGPVQPRILFQVSLLLIRQLMGLLSTT
jgi:hypothetical protein